MSDLPVDQRLVLALERIADAQEAQEEHLWGILEILRQLTGELPSLLARSEPRRAIRVMNIGE